MEMTGLNCQFRRSIILKKRKKSVFLWKNFRYFGSESCSFSIEEANLPENTIFHVNQVYQSFKDNKKIYYQDVFIVAQIMPLAHQPIYIKSYDLKEGEVKILRPRYDPVSGEFLGIEYCVALTTVRNDPEEQFFDYGYIKENSKVLFSTKKIKILSCFKSTFFGQHKYQYEAAVFDEQEHSQIFFYLPSTVDRNENINKYMTSVYLRPFSVDSKNAFGEDFNPADPDFNRSAVVSYMKKVAEQSSQNLNGNADAFLSSINHGNDKMLWPGGRRIQHDKFALTY